MVNKAVFLDRDGVIVVPEFKNGRSYAPKTLKDFRFYKNTLKSITKLKESGFLVIIVTNQPDVGKKIVKKEIVEQMHKIITKKFNVDDIEVCYHTQKDNCKRRKPKPGMILDSQKKWKIDLQKSYLVGDRKGDIDAAKSVGVSSIFIDHNYTENKPIDFIYKTDNLMSAVEFIVNSSRIPNDQ